MQSNNQSTIDKPKRDFYDPEKIKAIPITQVCDHFGIHMDRNTREPRCSIRSNDKHPSTVLHVESNGRFKANTYHDFGTNESGDVISLTCKMLGLDRSNKADRYQAMQYLGKAFQISPENRTYQNPGELSDREYRIIGLYPDRATKNFRFSPDHQSVERMSELSQKYNMTMNELKKAHPRIYEQLLKMISFPRLSRDRNDYYIYVWNARRFYQSVGGNQTTVDDRKELDQRADDLRAMERALTRAVIGTQLHAPAIIEYEPDKILAKLDSGQLKPNFGSKTYRQMERLAQKENTAIKCKTLDLDSVYFKGENLFRDIPFSAFFNNGNAIVRYLEKDADALKSVFQECALDKSALTDKLIDARERIVQAAPVPQTNPIIQR